MSKTKFCSMIANIYIPLTECHTLPTRIILVNYEVHLQL